MSHPFGCRHAALAEIGGAWLVWQGVREERGAVIMNGPRTATP